MDPIIGMLRRRIWLLVIISVLFMVLSVVLWKVLLEYIPKYTSEGLVQVKMPVRQDILSTVGLIPRADIIDLETKRKARQLTSDSFLNSLLQNPKVSILDTHWYHQFGNNTIKRFDSLKRNFKAVALQEEGHVRVSMSASKAKDAQTILKIALEQFQYEIKDVADTSLSSELMSLGEQHKLISSKISSKRVQLNAIQRGINEPGWQSGNSPIMQELITLVQERLRLQAML